MSNLCSMQYLGHKVKKVIHSLSNLTGLPEWFFSLVVRLGNAMWLGMQYFPLDF